MVAAIYNREAEQRVLAAMMIDDDAVATAREILGEPDFAYGDHVRIFRSMLRLSWHGSVVDPLTLTDALDAAGDLAVCGGRDYITFLIDAIPNAADIRNSATAVRNASTERRKRGLLSAREASDVLRITPRELRARHSIPRCDLNLHLDGKRPMYRWRWKDIERAQGREDVHRGRALRLMRDDGAADA